jgi:hypothetical protein
MCVQFKKLTKNSSRIKYLALVTSSGSLGNFCTLKNKHEFKFSKNF